MPQLNTFSNKSGEAPSFVKRFAISLSLVIQSTETIFFFSVISRNIPISTLILLSSTGWMGRRASYNCRLSIKQAIGKWILAFSLYYNSSVIKFDNQHDASTASTKAKLSAVIVLLTIQRIFLECHIIRDKFP